MIIKTVHSILTVLDAPKEPDAFECHYNYNPYTDTILTEEKIRRVDQETQGLYGCGKYTEQN